jgi:hemoglobin
MDLVKKAGGPDVIRAVVEDFYDHVFGDVMIGHLFKGSDKKRLIQKETELALMTLGAEVEYTGKSLASAHARFDIRLGMFNRRLVLLREAMARQHLDPEVQQAWLKHSESLRDVIVNPDRSQCSD